MRLTETDIALITLALKKYIREGIAQKLQDIEEDIAVVVVRSLKEATMLIKQETTEKVTELLQHILDMLEDDLDMLTEYKQLKNQAEVILKKLQTISKESE